MPRASAWVRVRVSIRVITLTLTLTLTLTPTPTQRRFHLFGGRDFCNDFAALSQGQSG